jgi:hypothetical protein
VNGERVPLDVPAQVIAGHTMVPLRFLSEALGANVGWDGRTRTVEIMTAAGNERPSAAFHRRADVPAQPAVNLAINAIAVDAHGWLHPGQSVRVVLRGTPGAQASFRVPGVTESIPMHEESPGRYVGVWQIPGNQRMEIKTGFVIGSLKMGDQSAPLMQTGQVFSIDTIPPRIQDQAPEPDTRIAISRPKIYAVYDDRGSGTDATSVRLLLDGHDVTQYAEVTQAFISFTPSHDLAPGQHTVQLIVGDKAGNKAQSVWKFTDER